MAHFYFR